jgi:hypothetical protein
MSAVAENQSGIHLTFLPDASCNAGGGTTHRAPTYLTSLVGDSRQIEHDLRVELGAQASIATDLPHSLTRHVVDSRHITHDLPVEFGARLSKPLGASG